MKCSALSTFVRAPPTVAHCSCTGHVGCRVDARHDRDDDRRSHRARALHRKLFVALAAATAIVDEQLGQPFKAVVTHNDETKGNELAVIRRAQRGGKGSLQRL